MGMLSGASEGSNSHRQSYGDARWFLRRPDRLKEWHLRWQLHLRSVAVYAEKLRYRYLDNYLQGN